MRVGVRFRVSGYAAAAATACCLMLISIVCYVLVVHADLVAVCFEWVCAVGVDLIGY